MGVYGNIWVCIGVHGKYMGLFEYSMDFLAIMECLWLYMSYIWGSYGYLWVFMGMYG